MSGEYDEEVTIPGGLHLTLIADGLVILGNGNGTSVQYYTPSTTARNINIRLYKILVILLHIIEIPQ